MKGIYRFNFDCGRDGNLLGIFVSTPDDLEKRYGRELDFGYALGKYSEIYGELEPRHVTLVTDDPKAVAIFEKYKLETGRTPFNDYSVDEDQDIDDEDISEE